MKKFRYLNIVLLIILILNIFSGCSEKSISKNAKPIKISIIDVSGTMQLVGDSINAFKTANSGLVSDIEIKKATALEVPSLLKAQITAEDVQTNLIFTGIDGLSTCMEREVLENIMPTYNSDFPSLRDNYSEGAKATYDLVKGYGITYVYSPSGPMFTYNPDKVHNPPMTIEELLDFAKANPGAFTYARPANSGPGRIFLQGLPYILGDKDPKNPKTWDKTWAFLKELDKYIDYYPAKTGTTFTELKQGKRLVIASQLGWDMNQRITGAIPQNYGGFMLNNTTLIADAQYMAIPRGLSDDKKKVALKLMAWLMTPSMQAVTYDSGYFYPGPAVKNISLESAPKDSQDKIKPFIRQSYEKAIATQSISTQLDVNNIMDALNTWDQIFGNKVKR